MLFQQNEMNMSLMEVLMEAKKLKLMEGAKNDTSTKISKPKPYNYSLGRMQWPKRCINGFFKWSYFET
jgi:hypothetical protein